MPDSATKAFESAFKLDSTLYGGRSNLVFGDAAGGRRKDAQGSAHSLSRERAGNSPNYREMVADLAFGENDAAMTALDRAVLKKEPLLGTVYHSRDPLFNPLKADPRFGALMQRLGATCAPLQASGRSALARDRGCHALYATVSWATTHSASFSKISPTNVFVFGSVHVVAQVVYRRRSSAVRGRMGGGIGRVITRKFISSN